MKIQTEIDDTPCLVELTYYQPGTPDFIAGHPDRAEPGTAETFEWRVLHMDGSPAPDLEDLLDREIMDRIDDELRSAMLEACE